MIYFSRSAACPLPHRPCLWMDRHESAVLDGEDEGAKRQLVKKMHQQWQERGCCRIYTYDGEEVEFG